MGDEGAEEAGARDGDEEERRDEAEGFAEGDEAVEEEEEDEHVGEVDLVGAATEGEDGREAAWGSPARLCGDGDEQAGAESDEGHVQAEVFEVEIDGLT